MKKRKRRKKNKKGLVAAIAVILISGGGLYGVMDYLDSQGIPAKEAVGKITDLFQKKKDVASSTVAEGEMYVTFLDVGQGDGIVVEIENRWNILIDGGSTNKNELGKYQLLPYLKSRGISRLDGIYVSHTDEDHISGVRELLEFVEKDLTSLRIENLILPKWSDIQENKNYRELTELAESAGVRVLTMKAGDEIRYGTVRLKVLWPESTASGKEVNEDAMVLEMISKDFKGLFTGDIGMVTEEKLIQNGCLEDVDFLKTAHHGSRYSTGAEFLEIVRPELAVVSCSATNTYGHPSPDTLERLKKSGSRVLITRDCGAVTIVNGKSVSAFNRIK